jgi:hypothetical protein
MKSVYALMIAAACLGGCKRGAANAGDPKAARELLVAMTKPGADHVALTNALRPKADDYSAVFVGDAAQKMKTFIDPLWDKNALVLKPAPDQTDVQFFRATPAQLAKGEGDAQACPPAYKDIADKIKPDVVVYCFRFAKPGEKGGLHADGLVWVKDHWALFPKPFRALKGG